MNVINLRNEEPISGSEGSEPRTSERLKFHARLAIEAAEEAFGRDESTDKMAAK